MRTIVGASLLWIALSAISDGVTTLVLPVRLGTGDPSSEATLGLIGSLGLVVGMVAQPLIGTISDRWRGQISRVRLAGFGVLLTALALGAVALASTTIELAVAFAALCLALAVTQAPQQALAADRVPTTERGRAAGAKGFADLAGSVIGFLVLGSLLGSGDVLPALALLAATLAVSYGLVVALLGGPNRRDAREMVPAPQSVGDEGSVLMTVVVARFLFLVGIYAVGRFLVPFIATRLDVTVEAAAELAGGLLALLALVTAVGSIPAGLAADRARPALLMSAGAGLAMAGIAIIALGPSLAIITIGGVAMAAGTALFVTANWRVLLDVVAGPSAGRLLGIANLGTAGASAMAGLAGLAVSVADGAQPGLGYPILFGIALATVGASAIFAFRSFAAHAPPIPVET